MNNENDTKTVPYYAIHKDGLISGFFGTFRFLSNFYILDEGIWFEELTFPSVEHAYQAAKWPARLRYQFTDITASKAKQLGKIAPRLNTKKWNSNKVELMRSMVYQKFEKNLKLRKMLLETRGYILEERNSWGDTCWGVDLAGEGENHLGKILMDIREIYILKETNDDF